jgi:PKD repeat protein
VAVTVNPNPVIIITPSSSTTFCQGDSVILTASGSNTSYTWSNSQTTNPITVNQSGNFTVSSTNSNNCTGTSANTTVIVNPLPVVNISIVSNTNGTVQFGNSTTGATSYSWNFGDGGSDNTATPIYQYTSSGKYNVVLTATSANGCIDSSVAMPITIVISGINDVSLLNGLKYFPNPFHQQLELQFAKQPFSGTLQVMNMLGQIVFEQDLENKSSFIVSTNNWADGNYLLHLKNNSVNSNIKIVKQ